MAIRIGFLEEIFEIDQQEQLDCNGRDIKKTTPRGSKPCNGQESWVENVTEPIRGT